MAKASKQVLLPMVRLAGSSLFKKTAFDDSKEPDFNGRVLFKKDSEAAKIAKAAIKEVFQQEFGADAKPAKNPLHCGSELAEKSGFDDTQFYMNFKGDERPVLVDADKNPIVEDDGVIYPGCYGDLLVRLYAWGPGKYGKGVGIGLRGFRFRKDGERLGGSAPASVDDFPDLDSEGEAGDDWMD